MNGVLCHHMIAVVKSSRVEGLTTTNAMPSWWSTKKWCNQYPQGQICTNINISSLTANHTTDPTWSYCPPSIAPQKDGHPKTAKRFKISLELTNQKKAKVSVQQQMENKIQEGSKDEKGGTTSQKEKEIRLSVKDGCLVRDGYYGHLVEMY